MRTRISFETLCTASEGALKNLGFKYYKNSTSRVVEFEVISPHGFLVRLEEMEAEYRPAPLFGVFGGQQAGSNISIIPAQEADSSNESIRRFAREFLNLLPGKPWEGLGPVESRTNRAYWRQWVDL